MQSPDPRPASAPAQTTTATEPSGIDLSVVVPVYNGATFISGTVAALAAYLTKLSGTVELILVDDGSTDETRAEVERAAARAPCRAEVIHYQPNAGKGAAIQRGMRAARGRHRVFLDADLAYPPENLEAVCSALAKGADVAIASRVAPGSRLLLNTRFIRYYYLRHLAGRVFNWIVQLLLLPGLRDSQAGLKGFTATAITRLLERPLPSGFSFDLALLFRARRLGLRIAQVPVLCRYDGKPSKVGLFGDTMRLLTDLLRIRLGVGPETDPTEWTAPTAVQRAFDRVLPILQAPAARATLLAIFGLSAFTLILARLATPDRALAISAWCLCLLSLSIGAWRSDLQRRPGPATAWFTSRRERAVFLFLCAACALLRWGRLGEVPPMVHGDSAACGLLGLDLLQGKVADIFEFSPWYSTPYISFLPYAASFWAGGISIAALRLPSALLGVLILVPLYVLVRGWLGVRAALLAAALYTVAHESIHFARTGLWNIQVLFCAVLAFALLDAGLRRASGLCATLAGIVTGLALYSYTAGRLIPMTIFVFLGVQGLRRQYQGLVRISLFFCAGLMVAALPLLLTYVKHPEILQQDRTASVWVLAETNRRHVEATLGTTAAPTVLWKQVKNTLAGFALRGDNSGQYGTEQPLLSPITAVLCLLGLLITVRRWRSGPHLFLLIWLLLGLVFGSVLVIDPPSYTRLVVLFPIPYILTAIALEAAARFSWRGVRLRRADVAALGVLIVAQAATFNLIGYQRFIEKMAAVTREWDVLKVMERLGDRYEYQLFAGPFLLTDSPVLRLFSTGTRAINGFAPIDIPDRLVGDTVFITTPEFRRIGLELSERFPGIEREVVEEDGIRQVSIYRCAAENGCRTEGS